MRLAVEYYQMMGVEVILQMPEEGETCEEGLERLMASDYKPTIFCLHQQQTLQKYADSLYDLTDSQAAAQLYSADFGMYLGEKLLALPVGVDWFGFIYNAKLLENGGFSRVDFHRPDMTGYHSISYIAQHLKSAGKDPFQQPDFTNAALLSALFPEEQLRSFVDLYVGKSNAGTDGLKLFQEGKIVFYAGTTADFAAALTVGVENLDLLPAFADGSGAMQYTCDYFWAVDDTGYAPDTQATLAFLRWMVSDRLGGTPIDSLGMLSPYKTAGVTDNALEKLLRKYMAEEPAKLVFSNSCVAQEDLADFRAALAAYYADSSDANWEKVMKFMKKTADA